MSFGYDPYLDYDFEDTPRYMAEQEIEKRLNIEKIERSLENDNR